MIERIPAVHGCGEFLLTILALFAFAALPLSAQSPTGTLVGVIKDSTGARVPAARIAVAGSGLSSERHTISEDRGEFRIVGLMPGEYQLTVSKQGFQSARSTVVVRVNSASEIAVTLAPAAVHQSVRVEGAASSITTQPISTTRVALQGVVTANDLQQIPLANRSFANIAYLVTGTEPVEPSDPTKARITAVSTGGSSGLNDKLSVDGVDNSDDYIGGFLQNFSPDAIEEFSLTTAQAAADTGNTTGSSVVIVTKRGTNHWHGDGAFYERAAALNARFPIDNPPPAPKQPFSRQNYIGTIGGPIHKGKLWFFSSFEYVNELASIAYSRASLSQFDALASLASEGRIPGVGSIAVPNSVPIPFHDALATTRFDWAPSDRSQWFLRLAADSYLTNNMFVQQGSLPSTGSTSHANYFNLALHNGYTFSPAWLGSLTFGASSLDLTEARNVNLGFALAFPFTSTSSTISGFETFGDNQFVTPITAFPVLRKQQKYQFSYDASHAAGDHAVRLGVNFIHEPVLSGTLPGTAENLTVFPQDPTSYLGRPSQFSIDLGCAPGATPGTTCTRSPATNGSFSQNIQRLGFYAQDSWRVSRRVTVDYGLRYDTTFGLFTASGRSQSQNPAWLTLKALQIPLSQEVPHDYRKAIAPRLGVAYAPGAKQTVLRAGFGLFYNDLAQNGWVTAFQAVNEPPGVCVSPGDAGCITGAAAGGAGAIIDPHYETPYAIHATAGVEHAFTSNWTLNADWLHEGGVHSYRRYNYEAGYTLFSPDYARDLQDQMNAVPNISVFRTDNRSSYDAMLVHLQGNVTSHFNLIANYSLSRANTWGCVLGELFDYVNGVCNPLHAFAPGDYGPSGEDVTDRFVLAGVFHLPAGFEISTLTQAESARPFTMTTPVDVNGLGDSTDDRAVVNGTQTTLDRFRGTPYIQADLRIGRPFVFRERWHLTPFIEFFNLFNRSNPGANFVTNIAALPTPVNDLYNATAFCLNASCSTTKPINSLGQLRVAAGALGDFFGPGTTVGIPFAAQIGGRLTF